MRKFVWWHFGTFRDAEMLNKYETRSYKTKASDAHPLAPLPFHPPRQTPKIHCVSTTNAYISFIHSIWNKKKKIATMRWFRLSLVKSLMLLSVVPLSSSTQSTELNRKQCSLAHGILHFWWLLLDFRFLPIFLRRLLRRRRVCRSVSLSCWMPSVMRLIYNIVNGAHRIIQSYSIYAFLFKFNISINYQFVLCFTDATIRIHYILSSFTPADFR